ncbi:hypothetical protein EJ04DRAFT_563529 [Polyplosphaeria fusca]|uniref:Uncharacterized protein n=1 Tax=Polyplosphaeria fusca TaxID=682080 RepID=A0A9P4R1P2_9PLEO|nr:hypothetical protein EJ04DRAFT_563529 [Polyplosphaeria fusca]
MLATAALLSLFAALTSVSALPAPDLAARDGEYIYWKYYGDNGCHGAWIDDNAIGQASSTGCQNVTFISSAHSFFVEHNDLTKEVRFYTGTGCTGNYVPITPGTPPNCYAGIVKSVQIIN